MNDAEWVKFFSDALDKQDEWRYEYERTGWDNWFEDTNKVLIEESAVSFDSGNGEMLKVTKDGFYVRGVRVEQGPGEAEAVYAAFKEFMTWAIISKPQAEE